jgi:hypothetical protein
VIAAAAAQFAFYVGVDRLVGAPPLHPPFLLARLIEDGSGYRYLKQTCPGNGFQVCQFLDRLPLDASAFLWASGTPPGVFAEASPAVKRQLAAEQNRFVLAVVRSDPTTVLWEAARNAAGQIAIVGLTEFNYDTLTRQFFDSKIPTEHLTRLHRTPAYRNMLPTQPLLVLYVSTFLVATIFVLIVAFRGKVAAGISARVGAIAAWALAGVAINDIVCGVLSGPHDRYSMRVAWLVPFAALMLATELLGKRSHAGHSPAVAAEPSSGA